MRKFAINVNGKSFEVEVEEIGGSASSQVSAPAAAPKAAAPAPAPVAAPAPAPASAGTANVCAPMPGNIWKILVSVGDTVVDGQAVVILEAMKMENELFTPKAGKVLDIRVKQGDAVDTGAILVSIG
jgi:glutaconyl-CoA decarboxylase